MLTKDTLRRAVNAACDCGGGEPGDCCPACEVWHALRLEEEQGQRIAVLEGDIRDYERSMAIANEEIRALKENWKTAMSRVRELEETVRVQEKQVVAVERENREKCVELAERAFEIRELRGVVDAAGNLFGEQGEFDPHDADVRELWKRLAALDLPDDAPRPEPEPSTLPRPILDLMAALKASLEVYDPHGLAKPEPRTPVELPPAVHPVEAAKIRDAQEAGLVPVVAERQASCPHCRASLKGGHPFPERREIRFGGPESPFLRCPDCSGFWELRPMPPAAAEGVASVQADED